MSRIRIGAVGYLNARPLVYGLERDPRFDVRFDLPARCAELLHAGQTDLGLIPSIEYLRAPGGPDAYRVVPDLGVTSRGEVASVALFTTREMRDVRSISLDTSSRTSIALTRVMCARVFGIAPSFEAHAPELPEMLAGADAALMIGDKALFLDSGPVWLGSGAAAKTVHVEKIDLGAEWLRATGLPFVYAFWAGRPGMLEPGDVEALQRARDAGVAASDDVACAYLRDMPARQVLGMRYLRENIKYHLGAEEQAGLELFYRYAAEINVAPSSDGLRFF